MATASAQTDADGVLKKPKDNEFKKPVSWLLGPQLIASLKTTVLYVGFKNKLDPRDWMEARVYSLDTAERFNTDCPLDEYWFDYLADSGDGQKATYSIAYLCLSDLWVADPAAPGSEVKFESGAVTGASRLLPRGEFLFIGGDTSYHMADYTTLAERFQAPFCWAFQDSGISAEAPRRPMLGLPANHDYYDLIDGFNRQLRKPTSDEGQKDRLGLMPQLSISGFKRVQEASYTAIQLPFGWWLWGLDNEVGRLDVRQQEFFRRTCDEKCEGKPPDKLIVATAEPTTVLGKRADPKGRLAQSFKDLRLECPFLFLPGEELPAAKCRLDLSGDTHQYARYWGPESNLDSTENQKKEAPAARNYASVVSGLGGAFLHPSHVNVGEVKENVVYPSPDESRRVTYARLFDVLNLLRGGYVAALGAFMGLMIFFAATVPLSSKTVVDKLLRKLFDIPPYPLTGLEKWFPALLWPERNFAESAGLGDWGVGWRVGLLVVSTTLIVATVVFAKLLVGLTRREKQELSRPYKLAIILLLGAASISLFVGAREFWIHTGSLSPFKCSVFVLLSSVWAAASIAAGVIYSEWLTRQARKEPIKKIHFWLVWVLVALGVGIFSAGVLKFGKYPFAYLLSDLPFAFLVIGVLLGLILLGVFGGGQMLGVKGKTGFGVLGLWHAVLQLTVPFLLVRIGSWRAWVAALVAAAAFELIGKQVARRGRRWLLLAMWLADGGLLLWLPFALPETNPSMSARVHLLKLLVAGLLGGLMSCIWLGWYLAVSLEFNGHYSEAGGAARIEEYKQFIRIRLTKDNLKVYVIGVDQPLTRGADLKARIIDVFELRPS